MESPDSDKSLASNAIRSSVSSSSDHEDEAASSFLWVNRTPKDLAFRAKQRPRTRSHAHPRKPVRRTSKPSTETTKQPLSVKSANIEHKLLSRRNTDYAVKPPTSPQWTPVKRDWSVENRKDSSSSEDSDEYEHISLASIVSILGAGRVDPFACFPIEKPKPYQHELVDHSVTYLLPGLLPDDESDSFDHPVPKAWYASALKLPFLFHALLFAGCVHLDFVRYQKVYPNGPRALTHKIFVIQALNEIIADPEQASRDEVILAILVLASHEVFETTEGKRHPFNPPLKNTQWINVYGNLKFVPEHMMAVYQLVMMRGGLDNIELSGLAEIIFGGDVVNATNNLTHPVYPQTKQTTGRIAALLHWATTPPQMPFLKQASSFHKMKHFGLTEDMIYVFDCMGAMTLAIDDYLQGKPTSIKLGAIAKTRTAIQGKLMSLPRGDELDQSESDVLKLNMYESCRLCALIYGIAVVFPVPNTFPIFEEVVPSLRLSLEAMGTEKIENTFPGLLLWMLVLGGVAALDRPERSWFVEKLAAMSRGRATLIWGSVEDILEGYLWLESACGEGGRLLWSEVKDKAVNPRSSQKFGLDNSLDSWTWF